MLDETPTTRPGEELTGWDEYLQYGVFDSPPYERESPFVPLVNGDYPAHYADDFADAILVTNRVLRAISEVAVTGGDLEALRQMLLEFPTEPHFTAAIPVGTGGTLRLWSADPADPQPVHPAHIRSLRASVRSGWGQDIVCDALWSLADYLGAYPDVPPIPRCDQCGRWFIDRTGGRAVFCSRQCRNRANYLRRREGVTTE